MPRSSSKDTLPLASVPLTSLNIGLWESDVEGGYIRGDATMAKIFGLSAGEASRGISIKHLLSKFHPDDLASDEIDRRRVLEKGGSFVWEHRVQPAPSIVRWVLARGQFERGVDGRMRGSGIIIDITDARSDDQSEEPSRFLLAPETMGSPAERMAERALEMWELKHELEAARTARLEPLLKALLFELGREIAASLLVETSPGPPLRAEDPKLH